MCRRLEETDIEGFGDGLAVAVSRVRLSPAAEQLAFKPGGDFVTAGKKLFQQRDMVEEGKPHSLIALMAYSRHYFRTHRRVDVPASFCCPYYWSNPFAFCLRAAVRA